MGWYSAVGRPAFLALPPEAAHRVANALLGLPFAWRHMGGVPDDPSLRTSVAELHRLEGSSLQRFNINLP